MWSLPSWLRRDQLRDEGVPPVVLISFDRPHYLQQVLEGFTAQRALVPERVHLFQDGAVNAYSGRVAAEQADIDACIALFRHLVPRGHVHIAPANIGITENFLRAERFVFEELGAEYAYFCEDDFVPSPEYLTAMGRVYQAVRYEDRIGYFAAYGDWRANLDRQRAAPTALILLTHQVAFGLKRSHWSMMQPVLQPYYQLVIGRDEKVLPTKAILAALQRNKLAPANAAQDNVKFFVTTLLGSARINTLACFGKYIGETGEHMTPGRYAKLGYHKTCLFDGPLPDTFETPTNEQIESYISQMTEIWAKAYQAQTS
ncbi:hypothetical protein ACFL17_06190 [Pseudomonadota bacterium]